MNAFTLKKFAALLFVAILLSAGIIRTNSVDNVPFCIHSAGCHLGMEPRGRVIDKRYGYPLTYKATETFKPTNDDPKSAEYAGYAEAKADLQDFTPVNIAINTLFWFSLLYLLTSFIRSKKQKKTDNASTVPSEKS